VDKNNFSSGKPPHLMWILYRRPAAFHQRDYLTTLIFLNTALFFLPLSELWYICFFGKIVPSCNCY